MERNERGKRREKREKKGQRKDREKRETGQRREMKGDRLEIGPCAIGDCELVDLKDI